MSRRVLTIEPVTHRIRHALTDREITRTHHALVLRDGTTVRVLATAATRLRLTRAAVELSWAHAAPIDWAGGSQ